jgi:hypothetical protein
MMRPQKDIGNGAKTTAPLSSRQGEIDGQGGFLRLATRRYGVYRTPHRILFRGDLRAFKTATF